MSWQIELMSQVNVAVGIVKRATQVFVSLRSDDKHQGGKWEFPGGKIEPGETTFQALARELEEEIGISVKSSTPFMVIEHDYGDKQVCLDIHLVEEFDCEPYGKEQQVCQWIAIADMTADAFPAANIAIVEKLQQNLRH